jgi:hypothetical protein
MRVLRDPRSALSDRTEAAGLAGDITVMNDDMAELLLSIVRAAGEPEELRARAAISLGPALELADSEGFDDDEFAEPPVSEEVFHRMQETLRGIYEDENGPREVRRRVLEASVRAPQDWHVEAIRAALASGEEDWKLTAVFAMRWVRGFEDEIFESLESLNPEIRYEAVCAAGDWGLDAAWPRIAGLAAAAPSDRRLLLAAIEAAGGIGSTDAKAFLDEMCESEDEEIADAAGEAVLMANAVFGEDDEDEDE